VTERHVHMTRVPRTAALAAPLLRCWCWLYGLEALAPADALTSRTVRRAAHAGPRAPDHDWDLDQTCVPENRKTAVRLLQKAFDERLAQGVRDAFAAAEGSVYMTVGEWHTNKMFSNFLAHMKLMSLRDDAVVTVVNAALDEPGHDECEADRRVLAERAPASKLQVVCINLASWLPRPFFSADPTPYDTGYVRFGDCFYSFLVWTKPVVYHAAVDAAKEGVMMVDTDVILYHDLVTYVKQNFANREKLLVTGREGPRGWKANTGTVFANRASLDIIEAWRDDQINWINDTYVDQKSLYTVLGYDPGRPGQDKLGVWQSMNQSVVGQCARAGTQAKHYSCLGYKVKKMFKEGEWKPSIPRVLPRKGSDRKYAATRPAERRRVGEAAGVGDTIRRMQAAGEWSPVPAER